MRQRQPQMARQRLALGDLPGIEVVGEATTGQQAIELAESLQPDVLIMDINMPELNGIDATRALTRSSPHVSVLILTMFDDDASVFQAMRAGARGYLLKGAGEHIFTKLQVADRAQAIIKPATPGSAPLSDRPSRALSMGRSLPPG